MLLHRVVGVIGCGLRPIAFTAAAPVYPDHAQAGGKQRCGEFDPVLAGEITTWMKTTVTSPPPDSRQISWTSPACTRATDLPYLFRPAVGDAPGGVGATGKAMGHALRRARSKNHPTPHKPCCFCKVCARCRGDVKRRRNRRAITAITVSAERCPRWPVWTRELPSVVPPPFAAARTNLEVGSGVHQFDFCLTYRPGAGSITRKVSLPNSVGA